MVTMLQLLTTLSTILINAPTIAGLHRGHPAPSSLIKEARALNARYRHICTYRDTYRRIHRERQGQERQRGLQYESNSLMLLEEHLFKPIQPRADNEQIDQHATTRVLRQVALEGSAQPMFFCSHCSGEDQHAQEECARCKGVLRQQQETIQNAVLDKFPKARIVATTAKLANMVFVEMVVAPQDDISEIDHALSQIPGVLKISPQEDSTLDETKATEYIGGGKPLGDRFCGVGGKGITMAILDSGIDYTHQRIGGPGTVEAYRLAYGTDAGSDENKQVNPSVFPTDTVIGGRDFLGESFVHTAESIDTDAIPDDNPIDANRHGTMVADAVLSVAPQTKLLACKVCTADTGTCPGFAVLQALEYALDPNGDGNTDDKVDIVNLSLGGSYLSSYYDLRTEAIEKVFQLGVLPVVAAGNEGNIPYIGGPGSKTPNAISVAATNSWSEGFYSVAAKYSSRGPGDQNTLKPDISAPSGLTLAAFGTGTDFNEAVQGTSFAAPIVAGALAVIKERCPNCSPFALKAILMNNAKRHVQYHTADQPVSDTSMPVDDAPNSLVGAGEVQLQQALDADVWAYCKEDTQPSLSFGLINAHKKITVTKTIKVINLSGNEQTLRIKNEFSVKKLNETQENPLSVSFSPVEQTLAAGCNSEVEFKVTLVVDASKAPKNRMTSGGAASNDPTLNDWNEFGGWVIIENTSAGKDVSLAYHALIRQASDLKIRGSSVISNFTGGPTELPVGLTNEGAGVAQVDAFELLFISEDDAEGGYGEETSPSDFRFIGYRVFQPQESSANCDYLLEFSFTTWEKQMRINLEFFQVHIDVDMDNEADYILFNTGVFTPFADNIGCVVRNKKTNEIICTGFAPDHSTNTANTILRVCSNDIGFHTPPTQQTQINVYILAATATHLGVTEVTDLASEQFLTIEFPQAWISAPSYDIYPGETLETLRIDGTGGDGDDTPLGLILITNSYRGPDNTGAATRESEALTLSVGELTIPTELTLDELVFPVAKAFEGPTCPVWKETGATCATAIARSFLEGSEISTKANSLKKVYKIYSEGESTESLSSNGDDGPQKLGQTRGALDSLPFKSREDEDETSKCPEIAVPRSAVLRVPPTSQRPAPTVTPATQSPPPSHTLTMIPTTQSPGPTPASPMQNAATQSPTSMMSTTQNATTQSNAFATWPTQNVTAETHSPVLTNSTFLVTSPAQIVTTQNPAPMVSTAQNNTTQSNNPSALPMQNVTTPTTPPSSQASTDGRITAPTVAPAPAASPNSTNAALFAAPTVLPSPASTPLRGSPERGGPLDAAIIMVGAQAQQRDNDPPGLPFISHGVSHFSKDLTLGLGLALSLLAQLGY